MRARHLEAHRHLLQQCHRKVAKTNGMKSLGQRSISALLGIRSGEQSSERTGSPKSSGCTSAAAWLSSFSPCQGQAGCRNSQGTLSALAFAWGSDLESPCPDDHAKALPTFWILWSTTARRRPGCAATTEAAESVFRCSGWTKPCFFPLFEVHL